MDQGDSGQQNGGVGTPPPTTYDRIRQLYRQNSEKMGMIAEDVVLPMNKRSVKRPTLERSTEVEVIDLQDQIQPPTPSPTATPTPYGQTTVIIQETKTPATRPFKPECQFPIFMVFMSAIQVGLFYNFSDVTLLLLFGYDPYRRHELWRFFTIMLAHSSSSHVWGNVIFQLILGVLLEMVHHWKRIAIIYLAAVVGGSLFITIMSPTVYGVGASAGVYGLLFAHLSTIIMNWNEMDKKCCRLFWLLLYIAYDVGINSYVKFGLKIETNTSHAGHIGGAITGFLVAIMVLRNFEKLPWEKKLQKICAGILATLFVIIFFVNIAFPSYYLPAEWNFDYEKSYVRHILEAIKDSPDDSAVKKLCEAEPECKILLDQYKHNGTIPV